MEKRRLGRTDLDVSVLCLGTMMYGEKTTEEEAVRQMDACYDRGVNFFDTAELYTIPPRPETQGESERIVGRWVKARGLRDKIIVATKITGRSALTYIRDGEQPRLSRDQIRTAVDRSLKNLQTDYIDLYQTHWPDRKVPIFGAELKGYRHYPDDAIAIEETLRVLSDLQREGKIRHVGLSNETPYGVMRHVHASEQHGLARVQSIQNAYNLVNRNFELGLAEIAHMEQVGLLAYSPIGQGALTGKYLGGQKPKGSRGQLFGRLDRYETQSADQAIASYVKFAADLGVDPAILAMQFVTTRSFVTSNIFGASTMAQLETIFASLDFPWTDDVEKAVNALHARLPNPCP
ncbi:MAG: aldo/keto reductase [Pseudomonadota bacterium]